MDENLTFSELDLERSILRSSFYAFVRRMWHTVVAEKPVWNWHIEFICNELQAICERIFREEPSKYDWVGNVPPGTSKSTVASILLLPWAWTRMPWFRFLGYSYSGRLAADLGRKSRDCVTSDDYKRLFPEIQIKDDVDAKFYFANTRGGVRYSVGTGGTVVGFHFHFILGDDPLNPNDAVSEAKLAGANHFLTQVVPSRKVNLELVPNCLIMQRLRQGDPSEVLAETSSHCRTVRIPAELKSDIEVFPPELEDKYVDGLMDPVRLPKRSLEDAEKRLGPYGYAGQYLQSPIPSGGGKFKVDQLKYGTAPKTFKRVIRVWDKAVTKVSAGSKSKGHAFTAGVKMGLGTDGRIWLLRQVERFQLDSWSRDKKIRQTAVRDGYFCFVGFEVEPGSGGRDSYNHSARHLRGFKLREFPASGAKEDRADPFSSHVNSGHFWIDGAPAEPWVKTYVEEMKYWPFSTHLDQIDASAHAYNFLTRGHLKLGGGF